MAEFVTRACSIDDSFEFIESPDRESRSILNVSEADLGGSTENLGRRSPPLTRDQLDELLDPEGRVVDEHALRKAVFSGGVEPSVRKDVWQFLFGLYPCTSTAREREVLLLDNIVKYHELKSRWKKMLVAHSKPSSTPLEQGLLAKYQVEKSEDLSSPDTLSFDDSVFSVNSRANNIVPSLFSAQTDEIAAIAVEKLSFDINSPETRQQIEFMKLQAQVYVNWKHLDMNSLRANIRVVDKDVPRTDRDYKFFEGVNNPHLTELRDILITYTAFQSDSGYLYAQGMNDILARFLVVFNNEVEAYWCFSKYMTRIQNDFEEEGMMEKISLVRKLLKEFDPVLMEQLESQDLGDLMFCHRWLLLGFKREFSFDVSLRCFEILSSHHLELSSLEAANVRRREQMKEFENQDGVMRTLDNLVVHHDFTFELFMCVALLVNCRQALLQSTDSAMVFQCINSLQIDLEYILSQSEKLFFQYCKKTVGDCFVIVEAPSSVEKRKTPRPKRY